MSVRRIKWRVYWRFLKLAKRPPRQPERTIIKSVAAEIQGVLDDYQRLLARPNEPKHPSKETGQFDYMPSVRLVLDPSMPRDVIVVGDPPVPSETSMGLDGADRQ